MLQKLERLQTEQELVRIRRVREPQTYPLVLVQELQINLLLPVQVLQTLEQVRVPQTIHFP